MSSIAFHGPNANSFQNVYAHQSQTPCPSFIQIFQRP